MHIIKSRNPVWLILDIIITIWLWKAGVFVAAVFFTFDSLVQLCYTILPDMVDTWDKNKKYRIFYVLFLTIALFLIIRHLVDKNVI